MNPSGEIPPAPPAATPEQGIESILDQIPDRGDAPLPEYQPPAPDAEPVLQEPQFLQAPPPYLPPAEPEPAPISYEAPATSFIPDLPEAPAQYDPMSIFQSAGQPAPLDVPPVYQNTSPYESAPEPVPNVFQMTAPVIENPNAVATPGIRPDDQLSDHKHRAAMSESPDAQSLEGLHVDDILRVALERRANDIHLTTGLPPMGRIDGEIVPLPFKMLTPTECRRLMYEIVDNDQMQKFETTHELDFAYMVRGMGRFRVNLFMQRGAVAAAMRSIPQRIPSFEELNLPETIREIAKRKSGLILVTGPTGSGKSTTIATMIDDINDNLQGHIVTIEDPIEYLHNHKKCMVNQREMHADTYSFHNALRAILREDPDIILVGELRDLETIEAALTLAETGHLVFGTLHTRNAPSTIDRIIDVFPSDQQAQIRVLLGNTIEGIISQQLLPKIGGGRIAALEIMTGTAAVKNMIREGKTHQMYSIIETSKKEGMVTMDGSLANLSRSGIVHHEECLQRAVDRESFLRLSQRMAA